MEKEHMDRTDIYVFARRHEMESLSVSGKYSYNGTEHDSSKSGFQKLYKYAKVTHGDEAFDGLEIKGEEDGYYLDVSFSSFSPFTVTGMEKTEKPENPTAPVNPASPTTPVTPATPTTPAASTAAPTAPASNIAGKESLSTGDSTNIALWLVLMALTGGGIAAATFLYEKKKRV